MSELMLIVNIVTIALLVAGLLYSTRLIKRIDLFLKSREDLSSLFRMFDETIAQAQSHTARLAAEAEGISADLQKSADEARLLLQDLRQTCVRAEKAYDKAERGLLRLQKGQAPISAEQLTPTKAKPDFFDDIPDKTKQTTTPSKKADNQPAMSDEERKRKEQMLEKMLRKASLLKKSKQQVSVSDRQEPAPTKKSTPTDVRKQTALKTSKGDINDAGEAIKRALNAMGLEDKKRAATKKKQPETV